MTSAALKLEAPSLSDEATGIFSISDEEYNRLNRVRISQLKEYEQSPAHYLALVNGKRKQTKALSIGTALHYHLYQPELVPSMIVRAPEDEKGNTLHGNTTIYKKAKAEAEEAGKTFLKREEIEEVQQMHASILSHPVAAGILRDGAPEQTLLWTDAETGVKCKAKLDWLRKDGIIADAKSTEDASFSSFQREVVKWGMHVQGAWYCDAIELLTGKKPPAYALIAIEKSPPYAVAVYVLDEATLEKGREGYRKLLNMHVRCLESGKWPAYPTEAQAMNLPSWAW